MPHPSLATASPDPGLQDFLTTLFEPSDLVELRLIRTWSEEGKQRSQCQGRKWLTPPEILAAWPELQRRNSQGANIFYGVNPRSAKGSTKQEVALCRTLWADLDDARPTDRSRWEMLPPPTLIVDSGHGVHLYWRLHHPVLLTTLAARNYVESILQGMYLRLGADSVQDVSRLLRLPGFANVKGFRQGKVPTLCQIAQHDPHRTYDLLDFQEYILASSTESCHSDNAVEKLCEPTGNVTRSRDMQRIRGLVRLLDKESTDRSKRDFYVVSKLLQLGCSSAEISQLVANHSKFKDNETYLERTLDNALRATARQQ